MSDHVCLGDGGRLVCLHCGASYSPATDEPRPIWEVTAIWNAFDVLHADCELPDKERCPLCLEIGHTIEEHHALHTRDYHGWLMSCDCGASSMVLWRHMTGRSNLPLWVPSPQDPTDFGRCYRLLARFPEWRIRIGEMSRYGSDWAALSAAWDELEALYREEASPDAPPRLYARMRELRGES
jgi:hypothetical protein